MTDTLINRAAIYTNSVWKYIPPYNLEIIRTDIEQVMADIIPYYAAADGGLAETYNRLHGIEFAISGIYITDTPGDGLLFQDDMRDWFRDSDGYARVIYLCEWIDSTENIKRIWKQCRIASGLKFNCPQSSRIGQFSFSLRTGFPTALAAGPAGITTPGVGPYEAYIYGGVYTPVEGADTTPGVIKVPGTTPSRITGKIEGAVEVTIAGNVHYAQKRIVLSPTKAMKVTKFQTVGCSALGSSGNTTLVVSDQPYTTPPPAGNYLSIDTAYTAYYSATVASGTINIAAGSPIYIFCTATAGHQGLDFMIEVEPQ